MERVIFNAFRSLAAVVLFGFAAACGDDDTSPGSQSLDATRLSRSVASLASTATALSAAAAESSPTAAPAAIATVVPPTPLPATAAPPPPTAVPATPRPPTATPKPVVIPPTPTTPPPAGPAGGLSIELIDGKAILVGDDGEYLGKFSSSRYDSDSICNKYGPHGSKYAAGSVRNPYGEYGSKYNSLGAYNPYTSTPPGIVYQQSVVGYLTKNKFLRGAVDPDILFATWGCD